MIRNNDIRSLSCFAEQVKEAFSSGLLLVHSIMYIQEQA
jgi:hypothetical protein